MSQTIRLLIADDHPVVRDGLRGIFEASGEFEVAGEAANGREAVDRAAALRPDVVLMDLRMPVLDGVSAIRLLAREGRQRAGARAHHLRHRHRRGARDRGRRHRLPAEGLPARRTAARRPRRGPRRGRALALGRHPAARPGQAAGQGTAQPARARHPRPDRAAAARTARPPPACSSARPRSRPTCCTSTPSSASTTAPPPWRPGSSAACCRAPDAGVGHAPSRSA